MSDPAGPENSLSDESRALLKELEDEYGPKLSQPAFWFLHEKVLRALLKAEWNWKRGRGGNLRAYAAATMNRVRREFIDHHGWGRLKREREDSEKIDRARQGGDGLADYMEHAVKRILKQAALFPTRWRVPGRNIEDLARELAAAITISFLIGSQQPVARVRRRRTRSGRAGRPLLEPLLEPLFIANSDMRIGREATVIAASRRRSQLYKRALKEQEALHALAPAMQPQNVPSAEDLLIQAEEPEAQEPVNAYSLLLEAGLGRLTSIQRRWLEAFKADFELHGDLNLARAAEALPRARTRFAASRAWAEIQRRLAGDLPPRTRREMAEAAAQGRLTAAKERR
ncbi:hypothetical protein F0U62_33965 [Cystobacter fuscus]|uniref:hypothetical protein n=1 Tax=Cystobacter fuscus TaxID=43 RepID=UPI002B291AD9|nr:hypothetical protein F0U62_33965 [Cystobacter fuscus]